MSQYLFTISFFYYLHVAVVFGRLEVGDVRVECVGGAEGGTPPTLGQWITVSTDFMLLLSHILLRTYVFHKNS